MWALELWDLFDAAEDDDQAKKKFKEMVGMEKSEEKDEDDVPRVKNPTSLYFDDS